MKPKLFIERVISNPIIQTIVIYVGGAWVMIELVEYFIEHFSLNERIRIIILIVLLCGLPIALFIAWLVSRDKETAGTMPDEKAGMIKTSEDKKSLGKLIRILRNPVYAIPGTVVILLLIVTGIRYFNRQAKIRWANEQALPEIEQLFNEINFVAAFHLVQKAEKYISKDPKFKELSSLVSTKFTILTDPPGADIYLKEYADIEGEWRFLGITPIDSIRMPNWTFYRWKIEKPGYETILAAAPTILDTLYRTLHKTGEIPPDMVYVEGYWYETSDNFLSEKHGLFIDKYEVTNAQYQKFIAAGGYRDPSIWPNNLIIDGQVFIWESGIQKFVDRTGIPGPRFWSGGGYLKGKNDHPVVGISWYEAAAYAHWAEKELPTFDQWYLAALGDNDGIFPWGKDVITTDQRANFGLIGTQAVGSFALGVSPFGCLDMAGNVAEWIHDLSRGDSHKIVVGGSWRQPPYMFEFAHAEFFEPAYANEDIGFRCVKLISEIR